MSASVLATAPSEGESTRGHVFAAVIGVILGGGSIFALVYSAAAFQIGVTQGTPWGSSLAMAALVAGLAMLVATVITAGTISTWALLTTCAVSIAVVVAATIGGVEATLASQVWDQLAWSPLVSGLAATFMGATYACGSARRSGAHLARAEFDPATAQARTRRLYVAPKPLRTSWGLSLLSALAAGIGLDAALLWLADHTKADPTTVALVPTGSPTAHSLVTMGACMAATILIMSAALSSFGPLVAVVTLFLAPAVYASTFELFSLGHSLTVESLRPLTLASPVMGVWGGVMLLTILATTLARRDGHTRQTRACLKASVAQLSS